MRLAGKRSAMGFADSLRYSEEGLVPVAVFCCESGQALMLAYANREAVMRTLRSGRAWFYSRSRKRLWKKGESSGNLMRVASVLADCDSDALAYGVEAEGDGNACHLGRESCFGKRFGPEKERLSFAGLAKIIRERLGNPRKGSYTTRLGRDRKLAVAKISEESKELCEAICRKKRKEVVWEACDLVYHALVACRARGVRLSDLEEELARRNRERRGGKAQTRILNKSRCTIRR